MSSRRTRSATVEWTPIVTKSRTRKISNGSQDIAISTDKIKRLKKTKSLSAKQKNLKRPTCRKYSLDKDANTTIEQDQNRDINASIARLINRHFGNIAKVEVITNDLPELNTSKDPEKIFNGKFEWRISVKNAKTSPIVVTSTPPELSLTTHRSKETPKKLSIFSGSPKMHLLAVPKLLKSPRKLSFADTDEDCKENIEKSTKSKKIKKIKQTSSDSHSKKSRKTKRNPKLIKRLMASEIEDVLAERVVLLEKLSPESLIQKYKLSLKEVNNNIQSDLGRSDTNQSRLSNGMRRPSIQEKDGLSLLSSTPGEEKITLKNNSLSNIPTESVNNDSSNIRLEEQVNIYESEQPQTPSKRLSPKMHEGTPRAQFQVAPKTFASVEKKSEKISSKKKVQKIRETDEKPLPTDTRDGVYNRFGFKLKKLKPTSIILKKQTGFSREKQQNETQMVLKGVRTNRRFELQMKAHNLNC